MAKLRVKGGVDQPLRLRSKNIAPRNVTGRIQQASWQSERLSRAAIKVNAAMLRWADKRAGEAYQYLKLDALNACMIAHRERA